MNGVPICDNSKCPLLLNKICDAYKAAGGASPPVACAAAEAEAEEAQKKEALSPVYVAKLLKGAVLKAKADAAPACPKDW